MPRGRGDTCRKTRRRLPARIPTDRGRVKKQTIHANRDRASAGDRADGRLNQAVASSGLSG